MPAAAYPLDPQAMRNVADILTSEHSPESSATVGVLSAMYGVTNRLVAGAGAGAQGDAAAVRDIKDELWTLHHKTAEDLIPDQQRRSSALSYVENCLDNQFEASAVSMSKMESETDKAIAHDMIVSVGERMSTRLMASHMEERGVGIEFMESDRVIVTDDRAGDASPDVISTQKRVQTELVPVLNRGSIVLMTGFYGSGPNGGIRTLGRGGSDLSATLMGGVLEAETVTLWKVECEKGENGWLEKWQPGFEGVVHDHDISSVLERLDYEEAAELAHFGKAVLHPAAMTPVQDKGIPVRIRNTLQPSHHGTLISEGQALSTYSDDSDSSVLDMCSPTTITTISNAKYAAKWGKTRYSSARDLFENKLAANTDNFLDFERFAADDAVKVALVGKNICGADGSLAASLGRRVVRILGKHGVACVVPSEINGSTSNLTGIVAGEDKSDAVRALHNALVASR